MREYFPIAGVNQEGFVGTEHMNSASRTGEVLRRRKGGGELGECEP